MAKKNRHASRSRRAVLAAVAVAIAAIVVWIPQFQCMEIEVEGIRVLDLPQVVEASGLSTGRHLLYGLGPDPLRLFSLRYGSAEDSIQSLSPYVRSVRARLRFPSVIRIEVDERIEVAYLAIPDGCVVIDASGVAVEILHDAIPEGIPIIEGATVTSVALGQALTVDDEPAIHGAIVIMDAIIKSDAEDARLDMFQSVTGLRAVSADTTYMTIRLPASGDSLVVRLGALTGTAETVEWLRNAIVNGHCDGLGKGVLDLSGTQKVFRPDAGQDSGG